MLSSDWSRMGSCPASNTMYYNISSREGQETGKKLGDKEIQEKSGEIAEEISQTAIVNRCSLKAVERQSLVTRGGKFNQQKIPKAVEET